MIRLDMTEYQNVSDIHRLIGAPSEDPGYLAPKVRENPFAALLLDEIEKAHPNILNLFLQVLDEGFLTDGWGRKLSFRNNIVIATSNAGADLIRKIVAGGQDANSRKEEILDYLQTSGIFKPEFLNRFDGIVMYHPLTKENLLQIATLQMNNLNKRLAEKKISIAVSQPLLEKIVELGYQPEYGARAMKRVIQDKIEGAISKKILAGEVKSGDVIEIKADEI
jgi:ATP-dependent Clp protease ATP-binding subunit ClpA